MTGYCKYCDSLTEPIIEAVDSDTHQVVWVGCGPCYTKRVELMRNAKVAE